MSSHTPGPWERTGSPSPGDCPDVDCVVGPNGKHIAELYTHCAECEANARLIAAAPEMAELLRDFDWDGMVHEERCEWDSERQALLRRLDGEEGGDERSF